MTSVLLPEGELRVARCDMLDKLIAVGDGDAALLYLYILRHGGTDGSAAARALRLSADRYERAAFTLNNLIAPTEKNKTTTDKSTEAPRYTGDELRRARLDDQTFSGLCDAAEGITGRALTEGQLRCLLTIYDYLGLDAGATIELLSYLKSEKGTVRTTDLRREANQWADMGIVTAQAAQQYLTRRADEKPLSEAIYRALGADTEQPAPKEQRVCRFALAHGFPADAVELAVHRSKAGTQKSGLHARHSAPMGQCGRTYGQRNHRSRTGNPHVCRVCRACRRRSDTRTADRQRHARRLGAGLGCTRAQSSPQHGGITYGIR